MPAFRLRVSTLRGADDLRAPGAADAPSSRPPRMHPLGWHRPNPAAQQPSPVLQGPTVDISLVAPAGNAGVDRVFGAVAGITLAAPAGSILNVVTGAVGGITLAAPAGTVKTIVTGVAKDVSLAAPAGTLQFAVGGAAANVSLAAPAGSLIYFVRVFGATVGYSLTAVKGRAFVGADSDMDVDAVGVDLLWGASATSSSAWSATLADPPWEPLEGDDEE